MELKKAIEHAEHKAADVNCCCREDHKQLAQWLKELAERRDKDKSLNFLDDKLQRLQRYRLFSKKLLCDLLILLAHKEIITNDEAIKLAVDADKFADKIMED